MDGPSLRRRHLLLRRFVLLPARPGLLRRMTTRRWSFVVCATGFGQPDVRPRPSVCRSSILVFNALCASTQICLRAVQSADIGIGVAELDSFINLPVLAAIYKLLQITQQSHQWVDQRPETRVNTGVHCKFEFDSKIIVVTALLCCLTYSGYTNDRLFACHGNVITGFGLFFALKVFN